MLHTLREPKINIIPYILIDVELKSTIFVCFVCLIKHHAFIRRALPLDKLNDETIQNAYVLIYWL